MTEYKELYLPVYFSWREMTEELTNEELGIIMRALLDNFADRKTPPELPAQMRIIYKFMLDSAIRTHNSQRELSEKRRESANKRWAKADHSDANGCNAMQSDAVNVKGNVKGNVNENVNGNVNGNGNTRYARATKKERYGDFDAEEAFRKALERSYGESFSKCE